MRSDLLTLILTAPGLVAGSLFDPTNTSYTILFRHDFGSITGMDSFPAMLMLVDSRDATQTWEWEVSLMLQGEHDFSDSGLSINHLSVERYWGDNTFKIGKYTTTVGVLDLLSFSNILNPVRPLFFDDSDPDIRRIPQWQATATLIPSEAVSINLYIEPFDRRYQDYTSSYLTLALDRFIPRLISNYHLTNSFLEEAKTQIFLPAFTQGIAPTIKNGVRRYYDTEDLTIDKTLVGAKAEWNLDEATVGIGWFNKYSEIPYVELDTQLLQTIQDRDNGWRHFKKYLDQQDLSFVKGVQGFRYNQALLYAETTLSDYGVRGEIFWRDKVPFFNDYSRFYGVGIGFDHSSQNFYNEVEMEWIRIERAGTDLYSAVWMTRMDTVEKGHFSLKIENYTIFGGTEGENRVSFLPTLTVGYRENADLKFQYLYYPDDPQMDLFVATMEVRF